MCKVGRHPYQLFHDEDLRTAELIRIDQALNLSLKEIAELMEKRRSGKLPQERRIEVMKAQLAKLEPRQSG
jgi:DNA-binding transcriptional MerR regulator